MTATMHRARTTWQVESRRTSFGAHRAGALANAVPWAQHVAQRRGTILDLSCAKERPLAMKCLRARSSSAYVTKHLEVNQPVILHKYFTVPPRARSPLRRQNQSVRHVVYVAAAGVSPKPIDRFWGYNRSGTPQLVRARVSVPPRNNNGLSLVEGLHMQVSDIINQRPTSLSSAVRPNHAAAPAPCSVTRALPVCHALPSPGIPAGPFGPPSRNSATHPRRSHRKQAGASTSGAYGIVRCCASRQADEVSDLIHR